MSSRKFIPPSTQNSNCNCFGNYLNNQYFLTQLHKPQTKNTPIPHSPSPAPRGLTGSNKNSSKRSLRKIDISKGRSPPNIVSRIKDEYYQTSHVELKVNRQSSFIRIEKTQRNIEEKPKYYAQPTQTNIRNNKHIGTSTTISSPLKVPSPKIVFTHTSPSPLINIRSNSPQFYQQSSHPINSPSISKDTKNCKSIRESCNTNRDEGQQEIIQFQLTEENLDSIRIVPAQVRPQKPASNSKQNRHSKLNQYFGFAQTFKSNIVTNKSIYKSIMTKNHLNNKKNQYQLDNPQLNKEKSSLKKISDVEETHSLANSNDAVSQDNESVVLGRLHQYGSVINPTSSFSPTMGSKLASLNTQSSIGKSYLKSFEFNQKRR